MITIALTSSLTPALASGIVPTNPPAPTEVRHVSLSLGTASRVSPGITRALSGKPHGEYRITSTLSVNWDGNAVIASTRYISSKVIEEIFDAP
jgi:hypothetical protein